MRSGLALIWVGMAMALPGVAGASELTAATPDTTVEVSAGGGVTSPTPLSVSASASAALDIGMTSGFGGLLQLELDSPSGGPVSVLPADIALLGRWRWGLSSGSQLEAAVGPALEILDAQSSGSSALPSQGAVTAGALATALWRLQLSREFDLQLGPELRYWFSSDRFEAASSGEVASSPQLVLGLQIRLGWTLL